ncbi:unnamed protein product [Sphagnum jensenii]|uniref:Uncharacterized protein n=2 Tax=Sphagnum jensenii TaxID=128206 RepID=A0ABP0X719_9BRYO
MKVRSGRCSACFKQFSSRQHLLQHLEKAGHSEHEPQCGVCHKHCPCYESLREHLLGRLAKKDCANEFAKRGCIYCLEFMKSEDSLTDHCIQCQYVDASPIGQVSNCHFFPFLMPNISRLPASQAVAMDCEMVGGGKDGSVDLCARVCLVDEYESVLLDTYVQPFLPVIDYRFEITGIKAANLQNAMPFKHVRYQVNAILGSVRLLVGHDLRHDLACLHLDYPPHLIRDTATYQPLLKTSGFSHKLRFLTETYLGYHIQDGHSHVPSEDAVAAMRLYLRMRSIRHARLPSYIGELSSQLEHHVEISSSFTPLRLSESHYYCWCLDIKHNAPGQVEP